jgi:hypothetical protein
MPLWLVPFVSAAGASVNGLVGNRWLGRIAAAVVACGAADACDGASLLASAPHEGGLL